MSAGKVHLTINDQPLTADAGASILDVCRHSGIEVPTLCHCDGLPDVGACRLCIIEIEGQRRPTPACTTPVAEAMVVRTHTPLLQELRRQTLELIFGERNHICPFCPRSGYCELQTQAYGHRMDHVRYDYLYPQLPVDNSHQFITLDHNRCILCSRCVRACDEWVGAHVLDFDGRGHLTALIADDGAPLGESSCVSCGTCVSVCPTGALFEKRSAHWQGRLPPKLMQTICPGCGVACRVNASVRHRQISELASAGGPDGNRILCSRGRFGLVHPHTARLRSCRLRQGMDQRPAGLEEVVAEVARRLDSRLIRSDPSRVVGLLSPRLPLETLAVCRSFLVDVVGTSQYTILDRANTAAIRSVLWEHGAPPPLATLDDLDRADLFLLLGCNLERWHGVLASYVRRGVRKRGARLIEVDASRAWFENYSDLHIKPGVGKDALLLAVLLKILHDQGHARLDLPPDLAAALKKLDDDDLRIATGVPIEQLRRAAALYAEAKQPMLLCGRGLTRGGPDGLIAALNLVRATGRRNSAGRWRLMDLALGANSGGARWLGPDGLDIETLVPQKAELAFVILSDDDLEWPREWLAKFRAIPQVIVMAAREHEILDFASAVVPTASWAERQGTFVNLEGRLQKSARLMPPGPAFVDEVDFFRAVTTVWRGKGFAWNPPPLPKPLAHVAHDHLVPCGPADGAVDLNGLRALAGDG